MKNLIKVSSFILLFLIAQVSMFSQEGHRSDGGSSLYENAVKTTLTSEMDMTLRQAEESEIGSEDYLLFKDMKPAKIEFINGQLISLAHVNFNVIRNQLFFQDWDGKFFLLNFSDGIKKVTLGEQTFQNFLVGSTYKPMVVLYQNENIAFLKGYYVEVSANNNAPRTVFNATEKRKVSTEESYYIEQNNFVKKIELNKKEINSMFQSQDFKKELKNYVKENRLSYRKEEDVKMIISNFF